MYESKIIADSISEAGCRLTTFEVTYPLIIHAEVMTHRVFSRNVASNRAIPVDKMIASVNDNPFIPERFPMNKAGMQNEDWIEGKDAEHAERLWVEASKYAIGYARALEGMKVHKQITNRLLAPFLWTTAVITSTDWDNFWSLRCHEMAQPEIQKIAYAMRDQYKSNQPKVLKFGEWHLPYVTDETVQQLRTAYIKDGKTDWHNVPDPIEFLDWKKKVSIGRCARVSYLNHGDNNKPFEDIKLCERLISNRHMSPTEHVATPLKTEGYIGNFRGWKQYRKFLAGESGQSY